MTVALIIAGGMGSRMGAVVPKQFVQVNGKPVLMYTLEAFQRHSMVDVIELVCIDGWPIFRFSGLYAPLFLPAQPFLCGNASLPFWRERCLVFLQKAKRRNRAA